MSRAGKKDPWLPQRLNNLLKVQAAEAKIESAARTTLAAWLPHAQKAVLGPWAALLAAGAPNVPPNPHDLDRAAAQLQTALETILAPELGQVFGEQFAKAARDALISDQRYREAYVSKMTLKLANSLSHQVRTEIEELVRDGIAKGFSMQAVAKGVKAALTLDGPVPRATMFAQAAKDTTEAAGKQMARLLSVPLESRDAKWRAALDAVRDLRHTARQDRSDAASAAAEVRTSDALQIARTTVMGALNGGTLAGMQVREAASGVPMQKQWLATADARTRPSHQDADGQAVGLDESFQVGDAELDHPGDPDGPPEEVENCRCCMLEVSEDDQTSNPATGDDVEANPDDGTTDQPVDAGTDQPVDDASQLSDGTDVPVEDQPVDGAPDGISASASPKVSTATSERPGGTVPKKPVRRITEFSAPAVTLPYEPTPYSADADETVACQNCALMNDTDAIYCDQCGVKLDSPGGDAYTADPDETIQCPQDQKMNPTDARFCDQDGYQLIGSTDIAAPAAASAQAETFADTAAPLPAAGLQPFNAILAVEGEPTGDGRQFAADALTWRELPLPLMFQPETGDWGHVGSVCVARIDTISRDGQLIRCTGQVLPPNPADPDDPIQQFLTQVENNVGCAPSVDLDDMVAEFPSDDIEVSGDGFDTAADPDLMMITAGRIIAATVVSTPAFAQVAIALGTDPVQPRQPTDPSAGSPTAAPTPAPPAPAAAAAAPSPMPAPDVVGDATPAGDDAADAAPAGLTKADGSVVTVGDEVLAIIGEGDAQIPVQASVTAVDEATNMVTLTLRDGTSQDVDVEQVYVDPDGANDQEDDSSPDEGGSPVLASAIPSLSVLLASAGPARAPRDWFVNPEFGDSSDTDPRLAEVLEFNERTRKMEGTGKFGAPLFIADDGKIFGHIATWGACHTGFADTCTVAPHSETDYAYFNNGDYVTAEGDRVLVGRLTVGGGHADARGDYHAALKHYDDVSSIAAYVVAGEDQHGIWVAGTMAPGLSPEMETAFRATPPSGDWRRIRGSLEMMGVHHVVTAGFPTYPRPRMSLASVNGVQASLTAAGLLDPKRMSKPRAASLSAAQVANEIRAFMGRKRSADQLARSVGRDARSRMALLVAAVHPE